MKIFAICLVKNEVDIIERNIISALAWADKIFIADHMSTDGTWDLICNKLKNLENVEVYGQINNSFHDGIRSLIYDKYKHMAC